VGFLKTFFRVDFKKENFRTGGLGAPIAPGKEAGVSRNERMGRTQNFCYFWLQK
jgi:hypothetical protein